MIKQLVLMAAVLVTVVFLLNGCAAIDRGPFNWDSMHKYEELQEQVRFLFKYADIGSDDEALLSILDIAFANYTAGQVAVASRDYEAAEVYFEKAGTFMQELLFKLKEGILEDEQERVRPTKGQSL